MGIPVLIFGKSGSGKSASLRNFKRGEIGIISVLGKPLPFKNNLPQLVSDDYDKVLSAITNGKTQSIIIDDCGYLMTNQFMRGHSSTGKGNDIFGFYNTIGDSFWQLIMSVIKTLPPEKIIYLVMHEDKNDFGDIKPKSIGKMLDEKVCVEGMFTIAIRCLDHRFFTQTTDSDVSKTPIGMFEDVEMDNDLKMVDTAIREYYNIEIKNTEELNNERTK